MMKNPEFFSFLSESLINLSNGGVTVEESRRAANRVMLTE